MFNTFKTGLLTLAAAAVLMPAVSFASTVSVGGTLGDQARGIPDFLPSIISAPPGLTLLQGGSISLSAGPRLPVFLPSVAAQRNPLSVNLRGGADLSLWNLVAAVHAQQRGDAFELVEASVASLPVSQPSVEPLSAVPLPPTVWLFVMGALGLAGTRLTGLSGRTGRAERSTSPRDLSRDFGGALPA